MLLLSARGTATLGPDCGVGPDAAPWWDGLRGKLDASLGATVTAVNATIAGAAVRVATVGAVVDGAARVRAAGARRKSVV